MKVSLQKALRLAGACSSLLALGCVCVAQAQDGSAGLVVVQAGTDNPPAGPGFAAMELAEAPDAGLSAQTNGQPGAVEAQIPGEAGGITEEVVETTEAAEAPAEAPAVDETVDPAVEESVAEAEPDPAAADVSAGDEIPAAGDEWDQDQNADETPQELTEQWPAESDPAAEDSFSLEVEEEQTDEAAASVEASALNGGGEIEEVVVTGSRIKGASETGLLPVTVLGADEMETYGLEATGDILANLAQAGAFEFNETTDGPNSARGDIATVNLRGLGSGNTLVLLNGRRYVMHPFTQDVDSTPRAVVNVNSIPSSAIARTEILKDGASSIYGADAAAGVVNLILNEDFEGTRISVSSTQYSRISNGIDPDSASIKFAGGYTFPNDNTHWNIFASSYIRDGIDASEKIYAASSDLRPLLTSYPLPSNHPSWEGDTQFRNTSSLSPWGQFQVGRFTGGSGFEGTPIRAAGRLVTGDEGGFHIQPVDDDTTPSGLLPYTRDGNPVANIDDDEIPSGLDSDVRYDLNSQRQLSPDIKRFNLFSTLHHDFDNGMRFFGELAWYRSATQSQRAAQPIDVGLAYVVVPARNYWNPFGPATLPNGDPYPNLVTDREGGAVRTPAVGSDVLITGWRPADIGPRLIETDSFTWRALGGLEGTFGDWDWESALFYSYAGVTDTSGNRISKTALFQQLDRADPGALNPFGGPGFHTASDFDPVRIETVNEANSSIASWDFEVSRPDLFYLASDDGAGMAFGASWRHESYEDDRDPRLDGTIVYLDGLGGNRSDVAGVSPTADSRGQRNVWSAYAELLMPIVTERPGAHRLDFQVAVRFEAFDDIDQSIFKPKVALAWSPVSFMTIRGGYSQGFRAPNLVQLFRGDISRLSRDLDDFWRAQANLSDASGGLYRRTVRVSNPELKAEDTETSFVGLQFVIPFGTGGQILFTTDLWNFDQENVISTFGGLEQLALDFDMRQQGSFNPNVVRAEPSARDIVAFVEAGLDAHDAAGPILYIRDRYINLDPRSVRGLDFALRLKTPDSRAGRFRLRLEASRLLKFEQNNIALQPLLNNSAIVQSDTDLGEELRGLSENKRRLNGNPTWRASGELNWRLRGWGASWSFNYVDDFVDTGAIHDETGEFWPVKDWFTMNLHLSYRFSYRGLKRFRVRAGLTNITDRDPPLADEGRGYFSSYHNNRGRRFTLSLSMRF